MQFCSHEVKIKDFTGYGAFVYIAHTKICDRKSLYLERINTRDKTRTHMLALNVCCRSLDRNQFEFSEREIPFIDGFSFSASASIPIYEAQLDIRMDRFKNIQFEFSDFTRSSRNKTTKRWRSLLDDGCEDCCTVITVRSHIETVWLAFSQVHIHKRRAHGERLLHGAIAGHFCTKHNSFIDNYACAMHTTVIIVFWT